MTGMTAFVSETGSGMHLWVCNDCKLLVMDGGQPHQSATAPARCRHCQCAMDDCTEKPRRGYQQCDTHAEQNETIRQQERAQKDSERIARMEWVDYEEGMVYDGTSDRWYSDLDNAIEDIELDGERVADHVLQTSEPSRIHSPNLIEHVAETWDENTADDDFTPSEELTDECVELLKAAQAAIEQAAPRVWYPTGKRIRTGDTHQ